MRPRRRKSLRGSVTQSTTMVRVDDKRLNWLARITIAAVVLVVVGLFGIWGWKNGWFHRQAEQLAEKSLELTQKSSFAVADIILEGRQNTDKEALSAALGVTRDSPILAFKPAEAEARISKLSWVSHATVERRLPDTIYVHIVEREPMARWQHENKTVIIDNDGKILQDANVSQFSNLPLLVGAGVPAEAKIFLDTLAKFPDVSANIVAAVRVSERRWDLHLNPSIVAKLPEDAVVEALKRLSILITDQKILDRNIVTIDLRIPDRLILESPDQKTNTAPSKIDQL